MTQEHEEMTPSLADKIYCLRHEAIGNANLNWCQEYQNLLEEVRGQLTPLVGDEDDGVLAEFVSALATGQEKQLLGFAEEEWDEIEAFAEAQEPAPVEREQ